MAAQREAGLLHHGGGDQKSNHRGEKSPGDRITLDEAGIDKDLAKRARKLASLPDADFNGMVEDWQRGWRPKTNG